MPDHHSPDRRKAKFGFWATRVFAFLALLSSSCKTGESPELDETLDPLPPEIEAALLEVTPKLPDLPVEAPAGTRVVVGRPDSHVDPESIDFLLSMSFIEAAQMAAQNMELPPLFRVAANDISHPRLAPEKELTEFKARGNVFLEINYSDPLIALAQEAEVTIEEVTLRGRPVLKRGFSVIEATSDKTVFYVTLQSLDIEGPHRVRHIGDRLPTPTSPPAPATSAPTATAAAAPAPEGHEKAATLSRPAPATETRNPAAAPAIDLRDVPADMTAEEIQRLISGEE